MHIKKSFKNISWFILHVARSSIDRLGAMSRMEVFLHRA